MKSERYHVERSELVVNETRFDSSSKLAKLLWKNRGQMSRLTTIEIVKIRREVGGRNGVGRGEEGGGEESIGGLLIACTR